MERFSVRGLEVWISKRQTENSKRQTENSNRHEQRLAVVTDDAVIKRQTGNGKPKTEMNRRETLKIMASAPVVAGFSWTQEDVEQARDNLTQAARNGAEFAPAFFTEHEFSTVNVLVDLIIPADERSGSATDAGVPEFMDFMMTDRPNMQLPMRGGLAWLDVQCRKRFGAAFVECTDPQQKEMLDVIAYPDIAPPEMSQGVAFFNSFRDLTASGFWSSKMGVEDLRYIGNTVVPEWKGCPENVLDHLGVSYDD